MSSQWFPLLGVSVVTLMVLVGCGGRGDVAALGRSVIVYSTCGTIGQSCVINPDGSGFHLAGPALPQDGRFVLSPDGTKAAVSGSNDREQLGGLSVLSSDGSHPRIVWQFSGSSEGQPAWNATGTRLALALSPVSTGSFRPGVEVSGLYTMNADGSNRRRVASAATGNVAWSPDGRTLAYYAPAGGSASQAAGGTVMVVPASGGKPRAVGVAEANREVGPTLSWAPDGKTILATSQGNGETPSQVDALPAKGGRARVIFRSVAGKTYRAAAYSPDGSHIAVAELIGDQMKLVVARADGSHPAPLSAPGNLLGLVGWVRASPQLVHPPLCISPALAAEDGVLGAPICEPPDKAAAGTVASVCNAVVTAIQERNPTRRLDAANALLDDAQRLDAAVPGTHSSKEVYVRPGSDPPETVLAHDAAGLALYIREGASGGQSNDDQVLQVRSDCSYLGHPFSASGT